MKTLVALTLALALTGCGGKVLPALKDITREDIAAAVVIARDNGDIAGEECYLTLADRLDEEEKPGPEIKGLLSTYAAVRIAAHRQKGGFGDEVHRKCAPLILDAQVTIAKVGSKAAGGPTGWASILIELLRGWREVK